MGEILGRREAEYFFDRRGHLGFRLAEVEASGRGVGRKEGEGIPSKEKFLVKKKKRRQYGLSEERHIKVRCEDGSRVGKGR